VKTLLVTGLIAKETVKQYSKQSKTETEVLALPIQVAALLKMQNVVKELKKISIHGVDVILIPGLIPGDTSIITDATGISTFKGPRYAADLPTVLEAIGEIKLSTVIPACDLLREKLQRKALQELELVEKNWVTLLRNSGNMAIKQLAFGKDFPMRVMAEIVDAPLMSSDMIQQLAKHYVKMGASIIDVGMIAGEPKPDEAKRAIEALKSVVNVPISIDTLNPIESREAVSVGVDLILSLDAGNVEELATFAGDVAVVAIPTNQREGYFPREVKERVAFLEKIIKKARKLGLNRILADLIIEPKNLLNSFISFHEFANRNPDIPLFLGASNFTELIDADSVGVNAVLAYLSSEVDASILLATEKSPKAKGTIRELVNASRMMFLAKKRSSVPKDLGLDLLVLKDKKLRGEPYNNKIEVETPVISATNNIKSEVMDKKGLFKITLDIENGKIVAIHIPSNQQNKQSVIIKGETSRSVYSKIEEMNFITRLDHAAYLGRELTKAEIALKTGKEYIQDSQLFSC
jgi:dihydropteroate synthase-like protein